jgi:hypothetical protein
MASRLSTTADTEIGTPWSPAGETVLQFIPTSTTAYPIVSVQLSQDGGTTWNAIVNISTKVQKLIRLPQYKLLRLVLKANEVGQQFTVVDNE